MPLYLHKKDLDSSVLAVWKLTDDISELERDITLSRDETEVYSKISNVSRKKQWLGCRYLIKKYYKRDAEVIYDNDGKPQLKNDTRTISMSHTQDFSAVIIGLKCNVGIDIEKIDLRLKRISHRMACERELAFAGSSKENEIERLTTIWCAKEAVFKCFGLEVANFSEDIFVDIENSDKRGRFKAVIKNRTSVLLNKIAIGDHILVYLEC